MEEIYIEKIEDIKKNKAEIEKKLNVKLTIAGNKILYESNSFDEYEASLVFEAISFGFSVKIALNLKIEDNVFKVIHIKDYTKRKLRDVKSRLIGAEGKTRKIISNISNCHILINESDVGIIGYVKEVENASTAITNLIKGSKQANMYRYLERMNRIKKEEGFNMSRIVFFVSSLL